MRSPTTYYQIVYPDMSVSRMHCDCEFTSLLAIKEAVKAITYCPIGTHIFFSDVPHYGDKAIKDEYCFEVERLTETDISIWEYMGEKAIYINERYCETFQEVIKNDSQAILQRMHGGNSKKQSL